MPTTSLFQQHHSSAVIAGLLSLLVFLSSGPAATFAAFASSAGNDTAYTTSVADSTPPKSTGHANCPCIDASKTFAQTANCFIDAGNNGTWTKVPGTYSLGGKICVPIQHGSNVCDTHDLNTGMAQCVETDNPPSWCFHKWCYVDPDKCRSSADDQYFRTVFQSLDNLYWSYSTCDEPQDFLRYQTIHSTRNKTFTVALPGIKYPLYYKRNATTGTVVEEFSPEAFDPKIPWQGLMVDYFNAVVEFSNIRAVNYVHRSAGSQAKGHENRHTQTVSDVQAEIVDLAVSAFWVTTERLDMAPFTAPVTQDPFKLWIQQPNLKNGSFEDNTSKILQPFSKELWLAILGTIVAFAVLSVIVSPGQFREMGDDEEVHGIGRKLKRTTTILTDSLNASMLEFLGGGVDYHMEANPAQKFLNFGFALTVFISVTAYTANLAAFLTIAGATDYISSIEEATAHNIPICASIAVKSELTTLHPSTNFVFQNGSTKFFEAYDEGRCQAFVTGYVDFRMEPALVKGMCDRKLVQVGNTIMNKLISFPARKEIVAGLSHWLVEAETQQIFFDKMVVEKQEPMCGLEIQMKRDDEEAELQEMTLTNMALPLTIFAICCAMALLIHIGEKVRLRRRQRLRKKYDDKMPTFSKQQSMASYETASECSVEQVVAPIRNSTGSFALPRTNDMHSIESAEDAMEHLVAYQQKIISRIKRLRRDQQCNFNVNDVDLDC